MGLAKDGEIDRDFVASRSLELLVSLMGGGVPMEAPTAEFATTDSSLRLLLHMVLFLYLSRLCERINDNWLRQLMLSIRSTWCRKTVRSLIPCGPPAMRECARARRSGDPAGFWWATVDRDSSAEAELVLLTLAEIVGLARVFEQWIDKLRGLLKGPEYKAGLHELATPIRKAAVACRRISGDETLVPARPAVMRYARQRTQHLCAALVANRYSGISTEYDRYVRDLKARTSRYGALGGFLDWRVRFERTVRDVVEGPEGIRPWTRGKGKESEWLYEVWTMLEVMRAVRSGSHAVEMKGCLALNTRRPVFLIDGAMQVYHQCQPTQGGIVVETRGAAELVPQHRVALREVESADILFSGEDGKARAVIDCKLLTEKTRSVHRLSLLGYMLMLGSKLGVLCTPNPPKEDVLIDPRRFCGGDLFVCGLEAGGQSTVYAEARLVPRRDAWVRAANVLQALGRLTMGEDPE